MIILITIIHIIVCLFLIIVVLLQSGKSGDIAAAFGGHGQPDSFRPARRGHGADQGHDLVRDHFYGDFHYALNPCVARWRTLKSVLQDELLDRQPVLS